MARRYIEPTEDQGRALFTKGTQGPNLDAQLSSFQRDRRLLSASEPRSIYANLRQTCLCHLQPPMLPYLEARGGSAVFAGEAHPFLIGPADETWDLAMVVRHRSLEAFLSMATDPGYLAGIGHREAALEDSRLLPIIESSGSAFFS